MGKKYTDPYSQGTTLLTNKIPQVHYLKTVILAVVS
jgi:hypothetical protein